MMSELLVTRARFEVDRQTDLGENTTFLSEVINSTYCVTVCVSGFLCK